SLHASPQAGQGTVTYDTDVAGAHPKLGTDGLGVSLRVEREHYDGTLPLRECCEAAGQPLEIERFFLFCNRWNEVRSMKLEKPRPAPGAPSPARDGPAARAQDVGCKLFRLADLSRSEE